MVALTRFQNNPEEKRPYVKKQKHIETQMPKIESCNPALESLKDAGIKHQVL